MIEKVSTFKDRLNEALIIRGIKPVDLSKKTHISEATISQYRNGYAEAKSERLVMIANTLQVDPSWLMGIDVPMEKPIKEDTSLTKELADLLNIIRRDTLLQDGIKTYITLSDEKKRYVLNLIHLLADE